MNAVSIDDLLEEDNFMAQPHQPKRNTRSDRKLGSRVKIAITGAALFGTLGGWAGLAWNENQPANAAQPQTTVVIASTGAENTSTSTPTPQASSTATIQANNSGSATPTTQSTPTAQTASPTA